MKNVLILAVVAASSAEIFKANPNLDQYFETSDGQGFYKQQDARNHAKTLQDKAVKTVNRADEQTTEVEASVNAVKPPKAADVIAAIEAAEDLATIEQYKDDTRPTVVAAFQKKTEELTKPAE